MSINHGTIKGYCHICGEGISGNVDANRRLECGMCVQRLVKRIENLEMETGIEIHNSEDYSKARSIQEGQIYGYNGESLKEARKKKGWTREILALQLTLSKSYVIKMEKGLKPLNPQVLTFIEECGIEKKERKTHPTLQGTENSVTFRVANKEDTDPKIGGLSLLERYCRERGLLLKWEDQLDEVNE